MAHDHRAGRQDVARKRRQRRQLLKVSAAVVTVAVAIAAVMIAFTNGGDSPSSTDQQPDASAPATWSVGEFAGGPRLAVDRALHDEGPVAYGQPVQAAFKLRNVGDQPLTLGDVSVNTLEGC